MRCGASEEKNTGPIGVVRLRGTRACLALGAAREWRDAWSRGDAEHNRHAGACGKIAVAAETGLAAALGIGFSRVQWMRT